MSGGAKATTPERPTLSLLPGSFTNLHWIDWPMVGALVVALTWLTLGTKKYVRSVAGHAALLRYRLHPGYADGGIGYASDWWHRPRTDNPINIFSGEVVP